MVTRLRAPPSATRGDHARQAAHTGLGSRSSAAATADPYELANGPPNTFPAEAFAPDHQADHPLAAIELILWTT